MVCQADSCLLSRKLKREVVQVENRRVQYWSQRSKVRIRLCCSFSSEHYSVKVEVGTPWEDGLVVRKLPPLKYYHDFEISE